MKYVMIILTFLLVGCGEYKHTMTPDEKEKALLDSCVSAFSFSSKDGRKPLTIEQHKYCVEYAKQAGD